MRIKKTGVPAQSLLLRHLPADYNDAFECVFSCSRAITPDDLLVALWTKRPAWINRLFALRNALVKPFGLKGGDICELSAAFEKAIRSGGESEIMHVVGKSPDETVIVLNDKHLTAYVSILLEDAGAGRARAVCGTLVHFHNRLGRVYFALIKPFHGLVVRAMLKYTVKKLTE